MEAATPQDIGNTTARNARRPKKRSRNHLNDGKYRRKSRSSRRRPGYSTPSTPPIATPRFLGNHLRKNRDTVQPNQSASVRNTPQTMGTNGPMKMPTAKLYQFPPSLSIGVAMGCAIPRKTRTEAATDSGTVVTARLITRALARSIGRGRSSGTCTIKISYRCLPIRSSPTFNADNIRTIDSRAMVAAHLQHAAFSLPDNMPPAS